MNRDDIRKLKNPEEWMLRMARRDVRVLTDRELQMFADDCSKYELSPKVAEIVEAEIGRRAGEEVRRA